MILYLCPTIKKTGEGDLTPLSHLYKYSYVKSALYNCQIKNPKVSRFS